MVASRLSEAGIRQRRRWSFANCLFDEANWVLTVAGRRVAIERKPLEMLRVLLQRKGELVTKEELLDAVWPDVEVVEASLPTAVRKLRRALGDDRRKRPIIQTAPRLGYRLAVPVEMEVESGDAAAAFVATRRPDPPVPVAVAAAAAAARARPATAIGTRLLSVSGGLMLTVAALAVAATLSQNASASRSAPASGQPRAAAAEISEAHQRQAEVAIREFDLEAVKRLIAAGWAPGTPWDEEGNDAFTMLLNHCEWDRGHDRRQMLLMARTMLEAGIVIDRRNVFGDTPYSIAKADRYCGPDHPVTQMLEAMCYGGSMGPRDRCLATYELTADQRRAQGLPPKG